MVGFLDSTNIESIIPVLTPFWVVIKNWWWLPLPFILWSPLKFFYLWFIQTKWDNTMPDILLEVDRKSTRLNSSHQSTSRMPSSA